MEEIIELRKSNERHFKNEDGTNVALIYDENVNYLEDGKYNPIDNTIIEQEKYYINRANSFKVLFPKCKDNRNLYELTTEKYFIKVALLKDKLDDLSFKIENNSITYKNILENIDIKYDVIGSSLKESIVLYKKPTEPISFQIQSDLEFRTVNTEIKGFKNDVELCTLKTPFMYSKNGSRGEVAYRLENGILTLILDDNFITTEEYPIIIDPTISENSGGIYDTYIHNDDSNINRGTEDFLKIGVESNGTIYRALIKFDLPTLPAGSQILSAAASFYSYKNDLDSAKNNPIEIHRITTAWDENTAKWQNMSSNFDTKIDFINSLMRSTKQDNTITLNQNMFDITRLVKSWYNEAPNNGFMIKMADETYDSACNPYSLYSKNHNESTVNPQPVLQVAYRVFSGIVPNIEYETLNLDDVSVNLNLFTGYATSVFKIGSTIGGKFSANLTFVHNQMDFNSSDTFYGWRFNLGQKVKPITISGKEYLEYIDSTGCKVYFNKQEDNSYIDEEGRNLKVIFTNETYTMTDKYGYKNIFTKLNNEYLLTKIVNNANDEVNIDYNSDNRIIKITDANDQIITVAYQNIQSYTGKITISSPHITNEIRLVYGIPIQLTTPTNRYLFALESDEPTSDLDGGLEYITDKNGKGIYFSYYDTTTKKAKKLSLSNDRSTIKEYTLEYDFNTTKVASEGVETTYTFSNQGNTIGKSIMSTNDKLENSYGFNASYIEDNSKNNNKMIESTRTLKYIKNIKDDINLSNNDDILTTETYRTGTSCYKGSSVIFFMENTETVVFSGYAKSNTDIEVYVIYPGVHSPQYYSVDDYTSNGEWIRFEAEVPQIDGVEVIVGSSHDDFVYVDDIQIEKGSVANPYNMVTNGDFRQPNNPWTLTTTSPNANYGIVSLETGEKTLKIDSKYGTETVAKHEIKHSGSAKDTYTVAFWYKNEGVFSDDDKGNTFTIETEYQGVKKDTFSFKLNNHRTNWQMFSKSFVTKEAYDKITLIVKSKNEANSLYLTDFMLIKDMGQHSFVYDNEGNLTTAKDLSLKDNKFIFDKNNQLIGSFTPKGNHYKYEYDNGVTDRILKGISPSGITNSIEYDSDGNPIRTQIKNINPDGDIIDNSHYMIRKKGTTEYFDIDPDNKRIEIKTRECNHKVFQIKKINDYYKLEYYGYNVTVMETYLTLSKSNGDETLFKFELLDNGSYLIIPKVDLNKALTTQNNYLTIGNKNNEDINQQFYFESPNSTKFIESTATYTTDGRFISSIKDSLGKTTTYDVNLTKGLTNSITDPNDISTSYTYDTNDRIKTVTSNDKTITYNYNPDDLLSEIISGGKKYSFEYDSAENPVCIRLGRYELITNTYDTFNKLTSSTYGNGDKKSYTYDKLNRIKTFTNSNDTYTYHYDNLGNLSKIESDNEKYRYYYDFANRLNKVQPDDYFTIDYKYDDNGNLTNKKYKYFSNTMPLSYEYNNEDIVTKVTFGTHNKNNTYDYLGRLIKTNIDNSLPVEYTYLSKGDRTSFIIETLKVGTDVYKYKYDSVYNITDIYLNGELQNHYTYDNLYQLVKDENYSTNISTNYAYDPEGNILYKKTTDLDTGKFKSRDLFDYSSSKNEDQVTKFNNESITYDDIGNPITIGSKVLTWTNGSQLASYTDSNNNLSVTYKYNIDGIRKSKIVNNIRTEYFLEGSDVILERTQDNVIYYIRDEVGSLIGFKYNNQEYYYIKNLQEDIIGITDSNFNRRATYEYDAWGRLISVKDSSGVEITDQTHIAHINPFRYRSYYYDKETGLYYLKTRYYNPEWGRFINADSCIFTGQDIISGNMYLYTGNNYISRFDKTGYTWFPVAGAFYGAIISVIGYSINTIPTSDFKIRDAFAAFASGAYSGFLMTTPFGLTPEGALASSYGSAFISSVISGNDTATIATDTIINGTINMVAGDIANDVDSINPGWFRPETLKTSFTGNYTQHLATNMGVSTAVSTSAGFKKRPTAGDVIRDMIDKSIKGFGGWIISAASGLAGGGGGGHGF